MTALRWMGVPESPGPRHAFYGEISRDVHAPCGAYPHPRDVVGGGTGLCEECSRKVRIRMRRDEAQVGGPRRP